MKTNKNDKQNIKANIFTEAELERYFHHSYGDKIMTLAMLALNHRTGQEGGSATAEAELAELLESLYPKTTDAKG